MLGLFGAVFFFPAASSDAAPNVSKKQVGKKHVGKKHAGADKNRAASAKHKANAKTAKTARERTAKGKAKTKPHRLPSGIAGRHAVRALCSGTYSSDWTRLPAAVRFEEASSRYTFCLRSTAVYQCIDYDESGKIRRTRKSVRRHGTAFAFRRKNKQTYLLTNEHVSEWPFVTGGTNKVDDVPDGCKRLSQSVTIVDNENDSYSRDDVQLSRVVVDPELDVSVLKGSVSVNRIPFTLGQSAALKSGDAVQSRGYPLGAFQALTTGKVINPRDHDQEGTWNHLDFVIDARLSPGNSGSPVLALSCKTGRLELIGTYHAAYRGGSGLNVVVGIDEFREILTTLKPRRRPKVVPRRLTRHDRVRLLAHMQAATVTPIVPFGGHVVRIRSRGPRLYYDLFEKGFPLVDVRTLVIEDMPARGYGRIGRIRFSANGKTRERSFSQLKAGDQTSVAQFVEALRRHAFAVFHYRRQVALPDTSRAHHDHLRRLKRELARNAAARKALVKTMNDVAQRLADNKAH